MLAASNTPPAPAQSRLEFIETLRGLAALYVLLYHLALIPQPSLAVPLWASSFILSGGTGVTLFFIVSAFTQSLSMRRRSQEPKPAIRFYIRRVFRIVPLFYIWIIVSLLRDYYLFGVAHSSAEVMLSAVFAFNFVPFKQEGFVWASWTLSVEMAFYLLFPLIFYYVNNYKRALALFFGTILIAQLFYNVLSYTPLTQAERDAFYQYSFLHQLPNFALGIFIFFVFEEFVQYATIARDWALVLIGAAALGYSALLSGKLQVLFDTLYWQGILFGALLLGLAIDPLRLVVNKVTRFYGEISYSVYLNHPTTVFLLIPLYRIIYGLALPTTLKYGACLLITLALLTVLSYATYRLIERPGINLGNQLIKKLGARRLAAYSRPL